MTFRPIALAALLLLSACADKAAPLPAAGASSVAAAESAACAASGGVQRPVCRLQRQMCVRPYRDGGRVCSDDDQCAGGCLYEGAAVAADGTTTGLCRKNDDPCGCVEHVVGGKRANGICVD